MGTPDRGPRPFQTCAAAETGIQDAGERQGGPGAPGARLQSWPLAPLQLSGETVPGSPRASVCPPGIRHNARPACCWGWCGCQGRHRHEKVFGSPGWQCRVLHGRRAAPALSLSSPISLTAPLSNFTASPPPSSAGVELHSLTHSFMLSFTHVFIHSSIQLALIIQCLLVPEIAIISTDMATSLMDLSVQWGNQALNK